MSHGLFGDKGAVGDGVGDTLGCGVTGDALGCGVTGDALGCTVGDAVGNLVGDVVGECVGEALGDALGDTVGAADGASVTRSSRVGNVKITVPFVMANSGILVANSDVTLSMCSSIKIASNSSAEPGCRGKSRKKNVTM